MQSKNAIQCFKIPARCLHTALYVRRSLASSVGFSLDLGNVTSEAGTLVDEPFQ
ncbi:hypothetical protein LLE64_22120 [Xanthomonas campestris pv. plantaginis]|nr:hypothetical protein [Xanthomonas campestris pv. plantaginis]